MLSARGKVGQRRAHAIRLYFRFALSYRNVGERLAARGAVVAHETIRQWRRKFSQSYTNRPRRQPRPAAE